MDIRAFFKPSQKQTPCAEAAANRSSNDSGTESESDSDFFTAAATVSSPLPEPDNTGSPDDAAGYVREQ